MARAKRTDRTEARRRYRAVMAADNGVEADGDELVHPTPTAPSPSPRRGRPNGAEASRGPAASAPATPRPPRPTLLGSARAAYHPPKYREDIALLPRLLTHWSVLLSAGLAIAGTAILIGVGASLSGSSTDATASTGTTTIAYIASILVSLFVGPPPFGAALLIGFMLPRATYLVGLLFGILAAICLTVIILSQPTDKMAGLTGEYIIYAWVLGLIGSAFFASGIAWYKRFLELLNPNRGQRPAQKAAQKAAQGRGNAPRNRLSGSGR